MASAAKRKYVLKSNQEELLKSFYNNLGNDEGTFHGHKFVLEEDKDFESDISSITDESDGRIKQAVAPDVADKPDVVLVTDEPLAADVPAVDPLADKPDVAPVNVPAEGIAD